VISHQVEHVTISAAVGAASAKSVVRVTAKGRARDG
jgi:hypothetical protein